MKRGEKKDVSQTIWQNFFNLLQSQNRNEEIIINAFSTVNFLQILFFLSGN